MKTRSKSAKQVIRLNPFDILPLDVIKLITSKLTPEEVYHLHRLSKNNLSLHTELCDAKLAHDFPTQTVNLNEFCKTNRRLNEACLSAYPRFSRIQKQFMSYVKTNDITRLKSLDFSFQDILHLLEVSTMKNSLYIARNSQIILDYFYELAKRRFENSTTVTEFFTEESLLHFWAACNQPELALNELIGKNTEALFVQDYSCNTPTHFAVEYGHSQAVEILVRKNRETATTCNIRGESALGMAISFKRSQCIEVFSNAGVLAPPRSLSRSGSTLFSPTKKAKLEKENLENQDYRRLG